MPDKSCVDLSADLRAFVAAVTGLCCSERIDGGAGSF